MSTSLPGTDLLASETCIPRLFPEVHGRHRTVLHLPGLEGLNIGSTDVGYHEQTCYMPVGECGSAFGSAISNSRWLHLWSCHFHPHVLKATISSCQLLEYFSGDRCGWFPSRRPDLTPLMEALLERSTDTSRYITSRQCTPKTARILPCPSFYRLQLPTSG